METLYSLSHRSPAGSTVFDLVLDDRGVGWFRHRFDARGSYAGVRPASAGDIRDELGATAPATIVLELRAAAAALEIAAAGLREVADGAARTGELGDAARLTTRARALEAERRETLAEVASICDGAWAERSERDGDGRRTGRRLRRRA